MAKGGNLPADLIGPFCAHDHVELLAHAGKLQCRLDPGGGYSLKRVLGWADRFQTRPVRSFLGVKPI